jgi:hypothetical protein
MNTWTCYDDQIKNDWFISSTHGDDEKFMQIYSSKASRVDTCEAEATVEIGG